MLAALVGRPPDAAGRVALRGAVLEVAAGTRAHDRLELAAAPPATPDGPSSRLRLLGIGWATVDASRHAGALGPPTTPRPDELLGALARPGRVAGRKRRSIAVVVLEPASEGRLAAALARHGEGPVALYLGGPRQAVEAAIRRLAEGAIATRAGRGPFGRQVLVGLRRSGPFVLLVDPGSGDDVGAPPGVDWATIE